jgi:hypothetical protein
MTPQGTDKTDMNFRRTLPEIRCQSCLSPDLPPPGSSPLTPAYVKLGYTYP